MQLTNFVCFTVRTYTDKMSALEHYPVGATLRQCAGDTIRPVQPPPASAPRTVSAHHPPPLSLPCQAAAASLAAAVRRKNKAAIGGNPVRAEGDGAGPAVRRRGPTSDSVH